MRRDCGCWSGPARFPEVEMAHGRSVEWQPAASESCSSVLDSPRDLNPSIVAPDSSTVQIASGADEA